MSVLSIKEIEDIVKKLIKKYNAESAILFGSYARGDATPNSDIDLIIYGGKDFVAKNVFALAEDLRAITSRDADVFEIREVNVGSSFYEAVMNEGIRIA